MLSNRSELSRAQWRARQLNATARHSLGHRQQVGPVGRVLTQYDIDRRGKDWASSDGTNSLMYRVLTSGDEPSYSDTLIGKALTVGRFVLCLVLCRITTYSKSRR